MKKEARIPELIYLGTIFLLTHVLPIEFNGQEANQATLTISNLSSKLPLDVRILGDSKDTVSEQVPVSGKVTIQIPTGNYTLVAGVMKGDEIAPGALSIYLEIFEDIILSFSEKSEEWAYTKVMATGFREFESTDGKKMKMKVLSISDNKETVKVQREDGLIFLVRIEILSLKDQNYLNSLPLLRTTE